MKLLNGYVFMKQIGMRIKFLRMHSGLTQDDLSEKSGYSKYLISNIECGKMKSLNIQTLFDMVTAIEKNDGDLKEDFRYLFTFNDDEMEEWVE